VIKFEGFLAKKVLRRGGTSNVQKFKGNEKHIHRKNTG
jgi:hypothetical protein